MTGVRARIGGLRDRVHHMIGGDSLRGKIIKNVGWLGAGYGVDMVIRFASSLIITRLLDPSAYGLISTVMVFLTFATMVSDLGIQTIVLTDDKSEQKEFLGTLWTMQVLRGALLVVVLVAMAVAWHALQVNGTIPPDNSYANPLLPQLLGLVAFTLIIYGFTSLNEYRAIRHLERGLVTRVEIGTRILTTFATVLLVYLFRSVWAMAVAMMIGAAIRMALTHLYLPGPRMTLRLHWHEIKAVLQTSRWVAVNSALTLVTSQADKVLIGYAFGIETLGVYSIAFTLFSSATALISQLSGGMGIPVLRALEDKPQEEQERQYYRFRLPIDVYCMAAGIGMVLLGPLFFKIAYDPRYESGGILLALLGLKVLLMPLMLSTNFLYAKRRYKLAAFIGIFRGIIFFAGLAAAVWLKSLVLMVLVIAIGQLPEVVLYFTMRRTGVPFRMSRDGVILGLVVGLSAYLVLLDSLSG